MILRSFPFSTLGLRPFSTTASRFGKPPKELKDVRSLDSDDDHRHARTWLAKFQLSDVPKDALEVSYARSSGPGGQHVNKTNSKAVVRCDIHRAKDVWLPAFVIPALQKTQYYHAPNLLFQSQESRSAPQNLDRALQNLHATIVSAAQGLVRGETSDAQRERVRKLADADRARRKEMKMKQKAKKESRRKDW